MQQWQANEISVPFSQMTFITVSSVHTRTIHFIKRWCTHLVLIHCTEEGKKGGLPEFVEEVQNMSEAAGKSCGSYQWLPAGVLPALACVAAASIWRPVGKFGHAKTLLESATVHLQAAKQAAGQDKFDEVGPSPWFFSESAAIARDSFGSLEIFWQDFRCGGGGRMSRERDDLHSCWAKTVSGRHLSTRCIRLYLFGGPSFEIAMHLNQPPSFLS